MSDKTMKHCLVCQSSLTPTKLHCHECGVEYAGHFKFPRLLRLSTEHMKLAEAFLLCGGNLKALAEELDLSYPTLRKHIDAMMESLSRLKAEDEQAINTILADIEAGKRNAEEGLRLIREMNGEY
jgi:hypothetical protein